MPRVRYKLIHLLLAVISCANLLSVDLGHNHQLGCRPASFASRSQCLDACHVGQYQHESKERHDDSQPEQPCHDDDCVACRFLAQFQIAQVCFQAQIQLEQVEAVASLVPIFIPATLAVYHHCRALPCACV